MTLRQLNTKKVILDTKHGLTIAGFCEKYECDQQGLTRRISQLFTTGDRAKKILSDIAKNAKKPQAHSKSAVNDGGVTVEETDTAISYIPEPVGTVTQEDVADDRPIVLSLDELRALEADCSDITMSLEKTYKALWQERPDCRRRYANLRAELLELKKAYEDKWHEAEGIIQKDHELVDRMNEIVPVHREKQAELEGIRHQIEEMSKIVICVYANGEIAPLDDVGIFFDETGHEKIFDKMREEAQAEDFRPKDLRVVARVHAIVAHLGAPQTEIIFEDDEVETAYKAFAQSA